MKIRKLLLITILYLAFSSTAHASLSSFSYTAGGNDFFITLSGKLQEDGDTIVVKEVFNFSVDDVASTALPLIGSFQHFLDTYQRRLFFWRNRW